MDLFEYGSGCAIRLLNFIVVLDARSLSFYPQVE